MVGKKLRDILLSLHRQVLDVMVEVSFAKRTYNGKRGIRRRTFRLVAVRNDETGRYHCYFTNVPTDRLAADEVRATYAPRWQVELLFKAIKTHGNLAHLPSSKRHIVESLIRASVLATIVSQALYREVRSRVAASRHMPLLRWAAIFARRAPELLRLLVEAPQADCTRLMAALSNSAKAPSIWSIRRPAGLVVSMPESLTLTNSIPGPVSSSSTVSR